MTLVGAIGRTAIAPVDLAGANTARAVGVVPLSKLVNSRWVELWFRSPAIQIEMVGKAHEVARKTLNLEDVRAAVVAVPPRPEQDYAVANATELLILADISEADLIATEKHSEMLRQSILRDTFLGRLVPQDPNDEPASSLIERMQSIKGAGRSERLDAELRLPRTGRSRNSSSKEALL